MGPEGLPSWIMRPSTRLPNQRIWQAGVVLIVISSAACGSNGAAGPASTPAASGPATTSPAPTGSSPVPSSPSSPSLSCVGAVFDRMTLPQRVGQLFALGLADDRLGTDELNAIRSHHVGSVWFTETTTDGTSAVLSVSSAVQDEATDAATGGIGFYVAANQEGGLIQAFRGEGFSTIPSAVEQGMADPSVLEEDAATWGSELAEAGVNLDFAPVMDVVPPGSEDQNEPIGVLHREFGSDATTVASHGAAFIGGMSAAGVATTAKHFPGLGRVVGNTDDVADVVDTVTTPTDPSLGGFQAAVDAGVPFVMVALATYTKIDPDHLAALSPTVIGLLRDQLGFDGIVLSDDLEETKAVADIAPADRAIGFLQAGGDMIISKTLDPAVEMAEALVSKAASDPSFRALVDDAAVRVLRGKETFGLLPCSGD